MAPGSATTGARHGTVATEGPCQRPGLRRRRSTRCPPDRYHCRRPALPDSRRHGKHIPRCSAPVAPKPQRRLDNVRGIDTACPGTSGAVIMDHAALSTGGPNEDATRTVKLLSLHRAKGLEFSEIFLPAWENGVFPPLYPHDPSEERRLAYVALSRGMRRVTITYCDFRRGQATKSEFIRDIPPANCILGWQRASHSRTQSRDRPLTPEGASYA